MKNLLLTVLLLMCCCTALAEGFPDTLDLGAMEEEAVLEAVQEEYVAPALTTPGRERCGQPGCFWETPMDPYDAEAMAAMLARPMTVIRGDPRSQVYLRQEPDEDSQAIGEITCDSQGVHVLEDLGNGWTRVECYSSSFEGSRVEAWNELVTGYVPTDLLEVRQPRTKYAFIVDKLDQRLYIFEDGVLMDVLAVSTGLVTEGKPYNETRSGEYILWSLTGAFADGDTTCNYGIRYNHGDLLHELPHTGTDNYGYTEPKIGSRASHGCIRVQRKRTEKGVNARWIFNALYDGQLNSRLIIWEDWPGRQIPLPAADTPLYYNPQGGVNYHDSPTCYGVKDRYEPLTGFTYAQLDDAPYDELTACPYCVPPRRAEDIAQINAAHQLD
ncbi:MAG: L,D-transpeptidase family protein [Clostridia bacterium]|nr:L,D-transpeptidase family protein [Clostridia bacterium]